MAEYIEREALVKRLKKEECDCEWLWTILCVPASDVEPVKHGHWIECNYGLTFECSECKYPTEYNLTDYCPNCGAKMDGENNG